MIPMRSIGLTSVGKTWSAKTVFMTGSSEELQTGKQYTTDRNWAQMINETSVVMLALGILQNMFEEEYWDIKKQPRTPSIDYEIDHGIEEGDIAVQNESGLAPSPTLDTLSRLFAKTQRLADMSDVIVEFKRSSDAVTALTSLFQERDRPLIEGPISLIGRSGVTSAEARLRAVGRLLHPRYAILLIVVSEETSAVMSTSVSCFGLGADGEAGANRWNPSTDACIRLLLCSWVTPLILTGNVPDAAQVYGSGAREAVPLGQGGARILASVPGASRVASRCGGNAKTGHAKARNPGEEAVDGRGAVGAHRQSRRIRRPDEAA